MVAIGGGPLASASFGDTRGGFSVGADELFSPAVADIVCRFHRSDIHTKAGQVRIKGREARGSKESMGKRK